MYAVSFGAVSYSSSQTYIPSTITQNYNWSRYTQITHNRSHSQTYTSLHKITHQHTLIATGITNGMQHNTNPVITGNINAHSILWHSYTDDHRGRIIADIISNSDHITLNTDTTTRVPNITLQQISSPNINTVTAFSDTSNTTNIQYSQS